MKCPLRSWFATQHVRLEHVEAAEYPVCRRWWARHLPTRSTRAEHSGCPLSLSFVLIVAAFSFFSGICLAYHDVVLCGNKWVAPSISISPFGKGKKLQSLYLCSWSFITTGVGCTLFGGRLCRIEWMGAVRLLIGVGLLAAAVMARRIFLKH